MKWTLRLAGMGTDHQSRSQPNAASIPSAAPQPATYPTGHIALIMIPQSMDGPIREQQRIRLDYRRLPR